MGTCQSARQAGGPPERCRSAKEVSGVLKLSMRMASSRFEVVLRTPRGSCEEALRIAQRKCRSFANGVRSPACSSYPLRRAFVYLTRPNLEVSGVVESH